MAAHSPRVRDSIVYRPSVFPLVCFLVFRLPRSYRWTAEHAVTGADWLTLISGRSRYCYRCAARSAIRNVAFIHRNLTAVDCYSYNRILFESPKTFVEPPNKVKARPHAAPPQKAAAAGCRREADLASPDAVAAPHRNCHKQRGDAFFPETWNEHSRGARANWSLRDRTT